MQTPHRKALNPSTIWFEPGNFFHDRLTVQQMWIEKIRCVEGHWRHTGAVPRHHRLNYHLFWPLGNNNNHRGLFRNRLKEEKLLNMFSARDNDAVVTQTTKMTMPCFNVQEENNKDYLSLHWMHSECRAEAPSTRRFHHNNLFRTSEKGTQ